MLYAPVLLRAVPDAAAWTPAGSADALCCKCGSALAWQPMLPHVLGLHGEQGATESKTDRPQSCTYGTACGLLEGVKQQNAEP